MPGETKADHDLWEAKFFDSRFGPTYTWHMKTGREQSLHGAVLVRAGLGGAFLVATVIGFVFMSSKSVDKAEPASTVKRTTEKPGLEKSDTLDDQRKTVARHTFTTPEEVLTAYLRAENWEDRLPCVFNPELVRSQMATRYQSVNLVATKEEFKPGNIYAVDKRSPLVGERVTVRVDVHEGLPHFGYVSYVVVRTNDGYKVDWRESMKLGTEDRERAARNELQLGEAVLEVQVLKVYQSSSSHTNIDIRVNNISKRFVSFWSIGADLYDAAGNYLGHAYTNGSNLRAGHAATSPIIYSDVRALEVGSWKLELEKATIDLGGGNRRDVTQYYTLRELRRAKR